MPFEDPVTSLPADSIEGPIGSDQITEELTGKTITGSTIRTAATGKRLVMNPAGDLLMYSGASSETGYGELATAVGSDAGMQVGQLKLKPPTHGTYTPPTLFMAVGPVGEKQSRLGPLLMVEESTGNWAEFSGEFRPTRVNAGNIATGRVQIQPVANTDTSLTITGLWVEGAEFSAQVSANTINPGQINGVSASGITREGLTIWLNRTTTTATYVWWMLIGR